MYVCVCVCLRCFLFSFPPFLDKIPQVCVCVRLSLHGGLVDERHVVRFVHFPFDYPFDIGEVGGAHVTCEFLIDGCLGDLGGYFYGDLCVCVCVCVCEGKRERVKRGRRKKVWVCVFVCE